MSEFDQRLNFVPQAVDQVILMTSRLGELHRYPDIGDDLFPVQIQPPALQRIMHRAIFARMEDMREIGCGELAQDAFTSTWEDELRKIKKSRIVED